MRPSYSPFTIVTWFAASVITLLVFGLAIVNCAATVNFRDTVTINEGEPLPLVGVQFVNIQLRAGGAPGDRCDAMHGTYHAQSNICTILYPAP